MCLILFFFTLQLFAGELSILHGDVLLKSLDWRQYQTFDQNDSGNTLFANGSVMQLFEQQDPENLEWTVWFDGLYLRR